MPAGRSGAQCENGQHEDELDQASGGAMMCARTLAGILVTMLCCGSPVWAADG